MYCKECGEKLIDSGAFCKECGKANIIVKNNEIIESNDKSSNIILENNLIGESNKENTEEGKNIIPPKNQTLKGHKFFYDKKEVLIDTLGSGFLGSLFVQESFSKSVLFCSNKRVYQKGKLFNLNAQGKITYFNGEKSIDLREITGLSYYIDDPINRLKFIISYFIIGILGLLFSSTQSSDLKMSIIIGSIFFLAIGFISSLTYGLKKGKYMIIEYAGGMIMTNCNWYSKKSIKNFMKNISIQKDKLFE